MSDMELAEKYIFNSNDVAQIDKASIDAKGKEFGFKLMKRAALLSFRLLMKQNPKSVSILCGVGNNAGDGYLIGKKAIELGLETQLISIESEEKLSGDAKKAMLAFKLSGGEVNLWSINDQINGDWIVDAIFGTGINREIDSSYHDAITAINESKSKVISIDLPSGLCGNTGKTFGAIVSADITVTFVGMKLGLYLDKGPNNAGKVHLYDLGVDEKFYKEYEPSLEIISDKILSEVIIPRNQSNHKGDHGHVLLIGGNNGMEGAIRIASEASLRSGSGLVSVISTSRSCEIINQFRPEVMCYDTLDTGIIRSLMDRVDIIGVGPGLGLNDWATQLYELAFDSNKYLVLDADALNILSTNQVNRGNWILTPHPGEASRLLGCSVSDIQSDRMNALTNLSEKYNADVLLKGKYTLTKSITNGTPYIVTSGNPGMASAGMGDLLTGVISSLLGQFPNLEKRKIIASAAHIHSKAGDLAAQDGERGLIASDLLPYIRSLVNP